jgi:hypothetical protein
LCDIDTRRQTERKKDRDCRTNRKYSVRTERCNKQRHRYLKRWAQIARNRYSEIFRKRETDRLRLK